VVDVWGISRLKPRKTQDEKTDGFTLGLSLIVKSPSSPGSKVVFSDFIHLPFFVAPDFVNSQKPASWAKRSFETCALTCCKQQSSKMAVSL